jgi:hypothetical protein
MKANIGLTRSFRCFELSLSCDEVGSLGDQRAIRYNDGSNPRESEKDGSAGWLLP